MVDSAGRLRGTYTPRPWVEKTSGDLLAMTWDRSKKILKVRYSPSTFGSSIDLVVPNGFVWLGTRKGNRSLPCHAMEFHRLRCTISDALPGQMADLLFYFET